MLRQSTTKTVQVTTKNIKKEGRLCMKSSALEALCAKGVFQSPISGVKFLNDISTPNTT